MDCSGARCWQSSLWAVRYTSQYMKGAIFKVMTRMLCLSLLNVQVWFSTNSLHQILPFILLNTAESSRRLTYNAAFDRNTVTPPECSAFALFVLYGTHDIVHWVLTVMFNRPAHCPPQSGLHRLLWCPSDPAKPAQLRAMRFTAVKGTRLL